MTSERVTFDPDDARLTAYVLGELSAVERAAVDELLARDEAARTFVDELRRTAEVLERELAEEPAPALEPQQREHIERTARWAPAPGRWRRRSLALALGSAAALALSLGVLWIGGQFAPREDGDAFAYRIWGDPAAASRRAGTTAGVARHLVLPQQLPGDARYSWRFDRYTGDDSSRELDVAARIEPPPAPLPSLFRLSDDAVFSTFSIDVDTASYSHARREVLEHGRLPQPGDVRIEEFVNSFPYGDPAPTHGSPFAVSAESAACPWAPAHRLVRIGLRAEDIAAADRAPSNLVFLIDVSGSMSDELPLLVRSMKLLVEQLDGRDRVAVVVYAGASGLALPSTSCLDAWAIVDALERLKSGGSTNGGEGIRLAYQTARENLLPGGINRVILCTDGDFNVGVSDEDGLLELIEQERAAGVFLSVLGFGGSNLADAKLELLADHGNGHYALIDSLAEARKVLVNEMGGTLQTVAKDVKLQVEFNPAQVQAWRLLGYENRLLAFEDFADDRVDAGEIGAGLSTTALYELVPWGVPLGEEWIAQPDEQADEQPDASDEQARHVFDDELLQLRLRYKPVDGDTSRLLEVAVTDSGRTWFETGPDFKWAAGMAAFALRLRGDPSLRDSDYGKLLQLLLEGVGDDPGGYRTPALDLVRRARDLQTKPSRNRR